MSAIASQITSLSITIVYSTVYSRRRSKETSKLRVTGHCGGNSPVTGEFLAKRAINTLSPRQNGCHFADDIFKSIFVSENLWILLKNSPKFVPKVRINTIPALVQIMAWRRSGAKPLSETMVTNSLTHICVTRPQWVNAENVSIWWRHYAISGYRCHLTQLCLFRAI